MSDLSLIQNSVYPTVILGSNIRVCQHLQEAQGQEPGRQGGGAQRALCRMARTSIPIEAVSGPGKKAQANPDGVRGRS